MTNHPTAKCYKVIGYPEGHPLHSSSPTGASAKGPKGALAHGFYSAVVKDTAASGPTMPVAVSPSAAIAQTSSTIRVMKPIGSSTKDCIWLIDSGASMHLSKIRKWFANFKPIQARVWFLVMAV